MPVLNRIADMADEMKGWRRHLHLGFCGPKDDPLSEALGDKVLVSQAYEEALERGDA